MYICVECAYLRWEGGGKGRGEWGGEGGGEGVE